MVAELNQGGEVSCRIELNDSFREPSWIESSYGSLFSWLHIPKSPQIKNMGVVICNPFGSEYTHAHRSIRHLADNLSAAGYVTQRFDFLGTGDSDGSLHDSNLVATWLANIESVIESLKAKTGVSQICLVGIRLGALLAASFAQQSTVDRLVLWTPCVSGRRYVREMQAVAKFSAVEKSLGNTDYIDSAGFVMSNETAADLKEINLTKLSLNVNDSVLIVERDDLQTETDLNAALEQQGHSVATINMSGYIDMMAEPQETVVPTATIKKITAWLPNELMVESSGFFGAGQTVTSEIFSSSDSRSVTTVLTETVYIGGNDKKLFGILTSPVSDSVSSSLVVFLNSGSVHHVGPNRVYVQLCRRLAAAGVTCLRIDLPNLGDSVVDHPRDENIAYPADVSEDIGEVLSAVNENYDFKRIILAGICSGAYNTFHASLALRDKYQVVEAILINPLVFYRNVNTKKSVQPEHVVERNSMQYKKSLFDIKKWSKLLKGEVDLIYLIKFLKDKAFKVIRTEFQQLKEKLGLGYASKLSRGFLLREKSKQKISVFLSENDPGYQLIMSAAKNSVKAMLRRKSFALYTIADADHTFSKTASREVFTDLFVQHIVGRYLDC